MENTDNLILGWTNTRVLFSPKPLNVEFGELGIKSVDSPLMNEHISHFIFCEILNYEQQQNGDEAHAHTRRISISLFIKNLSLLG